jgi:hypothetical protein
MDVQIELHVQYIFSAMKSVQFHTLHTSFGYVKRYVMMLSGKILKFDMILNRMLLNVSEILSDPEKEKLIRFD